MHRLPVAARIYVAAVITAAASVFVVKGTPEVPDVALFAGLLVVSALASGFRVNLPLGTTASNLSISYTCDFASLLLLGGPLTTIVAGASAWAQSAFPLKRSNPPIQIAFNVAALVVTVHAAGEVFTFFGGRPGVLEFEVVAKPLVASALVYYLANTGFVAGAVALTSRQPVWTVWQTNFLWTAPSYFVGAGAAAMAAALWQSGQGWVIPLAGAPVYLTFRSYGIYLDRIASEKRHKDEVLRLHGEAVAALETAKKSEQRYALAAAGSNDGLWDWDIPADELYCSDRWKLMIGLAADTRVACLDDWLQYVHDEDRPGLRTALGKHLDGRTVHFEHEYRIRHSSGDLRWVLCRGIAVRDEADRTVRMAGSQTDVTDSRRAQETLTRAARHDSLTGLPNRTLFGELLQRAIRRAARTAESGYAVLFIDLDGFKLVNDSLGHLAGDQFLIALAQRLQSQLRSGDVLARLGGDEFAMLVNDVTVTQDVCSIADRLQTAVATPLSVQGRELYASASIGIVMGEKQYAVVDDVLRDADIAMYRAKAAGRGGYQLFDPIMHASTLKRLTLETELRRGIERNELAVYFQPIVDMKSTDVCGLEALVRWVRADGQVVEPVDFITVAEETGLIVPLTYQVLRDSCRQVAAWQQLFDRDLSVSVNISSRLFARLDFVDEVERAFAASGLRQGTLRLEITESVLINHSEVVDKTFARLRKAGVAVYLDDFGTGYSSLSYLHRYPIDALKLDKSFVSRMGTPRDDSAIGHAIVTLARELGIGLIAEGVETAAHAEHLLALNCPHGQGYLYAQPMRTQDVENYLAKEFNRELAAAS
jgi:diguanylate cyclase (GGDEF)-like protein/PAS domain S-box-containing protein